MRVDFIRCDTPEQLRSALRLIEVPHRVIAIYGHAAAHLAWIEFEEQPVVVTSEPEIKKQANDIKNKRRL